MNYGSIVLVIIILWIIIKYRGSIKTYQALFSLTATVELMIERGYFVQIGSQQIAYRTVCELVLFVWSIVVLIQNRKLRSNKRIVRIFGASLAVLIIGWANLVLFPPDVTGSNLVVSWDSILTKGASRQPIRFVPAMWIEILQIVIYLFTGFIAISMIDKEHWIGIIKKTVKWTRLLLFINCIEIITTYVFKSNVFFSVADLILGKSISTISVARYRGFGYELCGLTKESSHYAFTVFILFVMYFSVYHYRKEMNIEKGKILTVSLFCVLIIELLTMSFSTLYYLLMVAFLLWCMMTERKGKSSLKLLFSISGILISLIMLIYLAPLLAGWLNNVPFWGRRLNSVVEEMGLIRSGRWLYASTALEWSNRVRFGSTYEVLKLMIHRPLFGLGMASVTAHSSTAMLLAGGGIIGSLCYLNSVFCARYKVLVDYNKNIYMSCIFIYVLSSLFNSLALRPYYELWSIIIAFLFQFLSSIGTDKTIIQNK